MASSNGHNGLVRDSNEDLLQHLSLVEERFNQAVDQVPNNPNGRSLREQIIQTCDSMRDTLLRLHDNQENHHAQDVADLTSDAGSSSDFSFSTRSRSSSFESISLSDVSTSYSTTDTHSSTQGIDEVGVQTQGTGQQLPPARPVAPYHGIYDIIAATLLRMKRRVRTCYQRVKDWVTRQVSDFFQWVIDSLSGLWRSITDNPRQQQPRVEYRVSMREEQRQHSEVITEQTEGSLRQRRTAENASEDATEDEDTTYEWRHRIRSEVRNNSTVSILEAAARMHSA